MSELLNQEPLTGSKKIQVTDSRTLNFSSYFDHGLLSNIPAKLDLGAEKKTPWRRMGNWTTSDCTCAAAGHMIECWTANTTREDIVLTREVIAAYSAITGYDPITGKNDEGACYLDVLKYWRKTGIGQHTIKAYTSVDHKNHDVVKAAMNLFGGLYIGFDLPNTIIHKDLWEVMPGGLTGDRAVASFGGHAVNAIGYDDEYLYCVSWGKVKAITWEFVDTYTYNMYVIITHDFFVNDKTELGFDLAALEADLLSIAKAKKTLEKQLEQNHKGAN